MTAQERVDEWIEVGEGEARQQPEPQQGQVQGQNEEKQEEPQTVIVDSTITVDTVVEQNGKVEGTFHEEVDVQQSFTLEEPQPYGPDESLQDGKVQFLLFSLILLFELSQVSTNLRET